MQAPEHAIGVDVSTRFLEDQSSPEQDHYVFAYTIRLRNDGQVPARLISRHWIITDGNGKTEEVRGPGVVGETPRLQPGEDYEYTSGTVLGTAHGSMHGSYRMVADDGTGFDATVAPFLLSVPRTLH